MLLSEREEEGCTLALGRGGRGDRWRGASATGILRLAMPYSSTLLPRTRVEEIMDRPDVSPADHAVALAGLQAVNRVSRTAQSLLAPILDLARAQQCRRLSLLDVACGGGDVPLALVQLAAAEGLTLDLTLLDKSSTALAVAAGSARTMGIACQTISADVLAAELPRADVITSSLFLHHLDRADVIALLATLAGRANHLLLISDLRRSYLGLVVALAGCYVLSRSPIVQHDGPASVRAAWTPDELLEMADSAGLISPVVRPVWPWRMMLMDRRT